MRILHISHNFHIVGGSDAVFFKTTKLLEDAGHEVIPFCIESDQNLPSEWERFFPRAADSAKPRLGDAVAYFFNSDAKRKLNALLDACGPVDVAHLHIYHGKQTPSILQVLRARSIPVVQSLHEYKLACPVYTMQRHGQNCQKCVGGTRLHAITNRCKDGSIIASAVMAAESTTSRMLGDVRLVDQFICVSDFLRRVMETTGIPTAKLNTLHNFVDIPSHDASSGGDYLFYFGRIEKLKGLETLVQATRITKQTLLIAGTGNWESQLQTQIRHHPNIKFLGFKSGNELETLVARSKAVVVPSEWYENCPMSVLEAKALGRPIIGARIGGIPELVRDGVDGFLFEPGNVSQLVERFGQIESADAAAFANNAIQDIHDRFSPYAHLDELLHIYAKAAIKQEPHQNRVPLSVH